MLKFFKFKFKNYFYKKLIMPNNEEFIELINKGYSTKGDSITLGAAMLGDETITNAFVKIPLKTINRHGLIA